jgi:hypothetical protein
VYPSLALSGFAGSAALGQGHTTPPPHGPRLTIGAGSAAAKLRSASAHLSRAFGEGRPGTAGRERRYPQG